MNDKKLTAGNAAILVEYYSQIVRAWSPEREREHHCRRRARYFTDRLFRAAKLAGITLPEALIEKAREMRAFARFEDLKTRALLRTSVEVQSGGF